MSAPARFKASEVARMIRGARAAGVESFDIRIGPDGSPVMCVRPGSANDDHANDVDEEISRWARGEKDGAA